MQKKWFVQLVHVAVVLVMELTDGMGDYRIVLSMSRPYF